jgi:hypothetical protein
MKLGRKSGSLAIIGVSLLVVCASALSGWTMLAQAEEPGDTVDRCGSITSDTPAPERHLDPETLREAAAAIGKLETATIEEVTEDAIGITVDGVTILIQGSEDVVIYHVPPEASDELISSVHTVADEVNNAC